MLVVFRVSPTNLKFLLRNYCLKELICFMAMLNSVKIDQETMSSGSLRCKLVTKIKILKNKLMEQ